MADCSQASLERIIRQVSQVVEELEAPSRWMVGKQHRDDLLALFCTIPCETYDGEPYEWEILQPSRLVQRISKHPLMEPIWEECLARAPPSAQRPWRLIVGFDEYVPGNKTKVDNRRKAMMLVFSFLEMAKYLHKSMVWYTPIALLSSEMRAVNGGWPFMLRMFLRNLLIGPEGFETVGAPIVLKGVTWTVHAKLSILLSDGDGLRMALSWKGANALRPCFRHSNTVSKRSRLSDIGEELVDITCADFEKFKTNGSSYLEDLMELLVEAQARHERGEMSGRDFDQICLASGFHPDARSIQMDPDLRRSFKLMEAGGFKSGVLSFASISRSILSGPPLS